MLLADALRCGFDAVRDLEDFDLFGQFGDRGLRFIGLDLSRSGKPGLELVSQAGQFGQIQLMDEGHAEPGLVVTKLRLGDGEALLNSVAFGAIAVGHAFEGVEHGSRSLMISRKRGLASDSAFEIDTGR
jgi:hypothetical protein